MGTTQEIRDFLNEPTQNEYDCNGIITKPGKFEREPVYALWYWEMWMSGAADYEIVPDDGPIVAIFNITSEEHEVFNDICAGFDAAKRVHIWEDDQGFVYTELE